MQRKICRHRPEQLKLEFALWSRAAVMLLIEQEFGIELPIPTIGKYLPSYSPERNPDKRLNADLKHALGSRVQVCTKEKLRPTTQAHVQEILAQSERVMTDFRDPHAKYAADFN